MTVVPTAPNYSSTFWLPQPTGADGVARVRVWPGRWSLTAKPGAGRGKHVSTEVEVTASRETAARPELER